MVDQERNLCHFHFKVICGPKVNILLFIGEEWLSLLTLLKTGLSSNFVLTHLQMRI